MALRPNPSFSMTLKPTLQLSLVAVLSLAVYLVAFVLPYNVFAWWQVPYQTIATMTGYDVWSGVGYVIALLVLFALYGIAVRLVEQRSSVALWGIVITGALAFNAAMLFLYPVDSADIFDNILRGRMQAQFGANPYYQRPSSDPRFESDPFYPYAAWHDYPSAYAAGWELVASTIARLPGDGVIANVLVFKLVSVAAAAGTAALIALTLRRRSPERALQGVLLFSWNPLVIYVVAGNGHNDTVMVLFAVLGFYLFARGRFTLAAMAETAGALIKFIPALLFPVLIVAALRQIPGWRRRAEYLALTGAACALMVIACYAPYWRDISVFGADWRSVLYTTSLPTLVRVTIEPFLGQPQTDALISRAAALVVAGWVGWQCYLLWRDDRQDAPARAGLSILLFYLLVGTLWFEPWYAIWPLVIAALVADGPLLVGTLLLSLASLFKMPVFDYVMMVRSPDRILPVAEREWGGTLGTLGLPWFYFAYQSFSRWLDKIRSKEGTLRWKAE